MQTKTNTVQHIGKEPWQMRSRANVSWSLRMMLASTASHQCQHCCWHCCYPATAATICYCHRQLLLLLLCRGLHPYAQIDRTCTKCAPPTGSMQVHSLSCHQSRRHPNTVTPLLLLRLFLLLALRHSLRSDQIAHARSARRAGSRQLQSLLCHQSSHRPAHCHTTVAATAAADCCS